MRLDRETILAAALAIVDERGVDGLTLRTLGERLGVSHMAAYRHFPDKDAIVDALADRLLAQIRLDDPDGVSDPDELILGYIHRARAAIKAHPGLAPVIAARPMDRTTRREDLMRIPAIFQAAGFPEDMIVPAIVSLLSVTVGMVLYEVQRSAVDAARGGRYGRERKQLLQEMRGHGDAPQETQDLIASLLGSDWPSMVFETTIRDVYDGWKRRAGIIPT